MPLLIAFLVAFTLTAAVVPLAALVARRAGLYAQPSRDRWHERPVPKAGGVAMLLPLAGLAWFLEPGSSLWPVLLVSGLMFALGLADDLRAMRPATKLLFQMVFAALLLYLLPPVRITGQPAADLVLAFVWLVGITNAFNLLDNIDGLAAGVAAIAGVFFLLILHADGGPTTGPVALAMAAFVGVTAAFLLYNFQPASIFMGDGGSHLLGSFFAGVTLVSATALEASIAPVAAIPVVLLLIPIFDTAFVTFTRRLTGRSAFTGGRDHTSHRLVALGIGERRAVLTLYGLTFAGGWVALGLQALPPGPAWGLVALYVVALAVIGVYLGHIDASHDGPAAAPPPLPTELASRYRAYEVLLDALVLTGAYYLSFLIRFREPELTQFVPYFTRSLPLVVGAQLATMWAAGKYRQVWRPAGHPEIADLLRASLLGVAVSVIAVLYLHRFEGYSRWVFAFDAVFAPTFVIGVRIGLDALDAYLRRHRRHARVTFVYGAGRGGALVARELLQNPELGLTPVGFLDDDPAKRRRRVDGLAVVGTLDDLPAILARRAPGSTVVVVSIRDLPRDTLDRLTAMCDARGAEVRRLRFALEDLPRHDRPAADVVRFPGN